MSAIPSERASRAARYWIGRTTDGDEALLRRLPGRRAEIWVSYRPMLGEQPYPPALAADQRPKAVGRAAAERFLLQRWVVPTFLDEGDPAPPLPGRLSDWSWEPGPVVARPMVRDRWVTAPPFFA